MGRYVDYYCGDNNRELKKIVNLILKRKFNWIAQKDYDDFYSRAGEVVWECENIFDETKGISFESYLRSCIYRKIKTQVTYVNRAKRMGRDTEGRPLYDVSIDTPVGEDGDITIGDLVPSDFDMENTLERRCELQNERIEAYLNGLSSIQRQIVEMKMEDAHASEIKKALRLSDKQYKQHCQELKSFANIHILYTNDKKAELKEEDREMSTATQTMENCKTDKISIASIIKKIEKHTIRFDHPLQRESDQWSPAMKGNLISDILQGNKLHPLIFAEQIINGAAII